MYVAALVPILPSWKSILGSKSEGRGQLFSFTWILLDSGILSIALTLHDHRRISEK